MKTKSLPLAVLFVFVFIASHNVCAQSLGVGTNTPNAKAALHVESPANNQGFMMPRLTTAQRTTMTGTLTSGENGLMAYDTQLKTIYIWNGVKWNTVAKLATPYNDTILSAPNNSALFGMLYSGSAVENVAIAYFENTNPNNGYPALIVRSNSNQPLTPAVLGENTGTNAGGVFRIINAANNYSALVGETNGSGAAVYGLNTGTAPSGYFKINNAANINPALYSETNGNGYAAYGLTTGTAPSGYYKINNAASTSPALFGETNGNGPAVYGLTTGTDASGAFRINNVANTDPALYGETNGSGTSLYLTHSGAAGNLAIFANNFINVARIDKTGKGFFNGGTQASGADVAEMFDVEGERNEYEPGDVLVISENTDRAVEKSNEPNSTKVAGVYATKPGVVLTEKSVEENLDALVPMGVIGVIPTKVCLENGPIKRGDLLVTSSTKGHAMKAIPVIISGVEIYPTGAILGKALENFDNTTSGLIKVLVNVK